MKRRRLFANDDDSSSSDDSDAGGSSPKRRKVENKEDKDKEDTAWQAELKVGDKVDALDGNHPWLVGTVVSIQELGITIAYDGWSMDWDMTYARPDPGIKRHLSMTGHLSGKTSSEDHARRSNVFHGLKSGSEVDYWNGSTWVQARVSDVYTCLESWKKSVMFHGDEPRRRTTLTASNVESFGERTTFRRAKEPIEPEMLDGSCKHDVCCPICTSPMVDAMQCLHFVGDYEGSCGHTFCKSCITRHYKSSVQCPMCRSTINHIVPNMDRRHLVWAVKIKCSLGCGWVGEVGKDNKYENHLQECPKNQVHCNWCNRECAASEQKLHICDKEWLDCHACKGKVQRAQMTTHVNSTCPRRIVECDYKKFGCKETMQAWKQDEHTKSAVPAHLKLMNAAYKQLESKKSVDVQLKISA